ncbi:hypothetical protein JCM10908_007372 [Rhodotorula pacifica]|uniref:glycolipid translocation protein n=1 Tax=Rhodotorula pacifica TaxID=1495444 RepID=UPI003174E97D
MPASSSTSSALSASLSLVVLQVVSRLFSFGLNQLLLRSTSPQAFGVATIQLDTLIGTVLFFVREGIRGAVARAGTDDGESSTPAQATLRRQTLLIPTLLSPVAILACAAFYSIASPTSPPPRWTSTLSLYALSILIELVSEPLYLETLAAWQTLTTKRVKVEGLAIFVKAVATLAVVRFVREEDALLAFGVGQLAYSTTIWAGLAYITRRLPSSSSLIRVRIERQPPTGRYFDPAILETGWALTKQSVIKQLLTEGDKLAVGKFGSSAEMGGYAVALNYGSLIARVVFQPLEESSRLYFSSLAAASSTAASSDDTDKPANDAVMVNDNAAGADMPPPPPLSALAPAASYLRLVLLLQTHLALIFFLLAPSYTTPLLHLLLGAKWSQTSASPILRAYAFSLPFLGANGITEAFFQAVASPRWIQRGAGWMVLCAGAFAGSCWIAVQEWEMGARGLILANCVNMVLRTAFSSYFIVRYFRDALRHTITTALSSPSPPGDNAVEEPAASAADAIRHSIHWQRWTPSLLTLSTFLLGGYVCRRSEAQWDARVMAGTGGLGKREEMWETGRHLGVGAVMGLLGLASIALSHRREISAALAALARRRQQPSHIKTE